MIYSRFGGTVQLIREATLSELLSDWNCPENPRSAKQKKDHAEAKQRIDYGMMWWAKYEDGTERIAELAFLRADDGWKEIDSTRKALMGEARYMECCGGPLFQG